MPQLHCTNEVEEYEEDFDEEPTDYMSSWPKVVSRSEAVREIILHSIDPEDFFTEEGTMDLYPRELVLGWLGY